MSTAVRNLARRIKISSLTEGFAPINLTNPADLAGDVAKLGIKWLGLASIGERSNEIDNAFDALYSLGTSAGGRKYEKATKRIDPRIIPRLESFDRTFARELGVDRVPIVRGLRAAAFGVRPRYDGVLNQLQLPTLDTPANITKQLGRAAVDLNPDNPLMVRAGKRVIPRVATGTLGGVLGAVPGVAIGTALGGPVGGVLGGFTGMGIGSQSAMTGVHHAASKAADDIINKKLSPVATRQFMDNYNRAARISRRGLLGKAIIPLALTAAVPAAYYAQTPFQSTARSWTDWGLNVPQNAERLQNALERNSFGRALLDYSARR